ncbi:hypothetical protein LSCM1_06321 [Leishmania martiniquensis]|uniref:Tyr recombinase domain-containing protein n=1 Tax=Leishmania martiniquensis TaxID=1580590 RepID=A0A836H6U6_9TRYP|nr:hypothetical protein LSCM1_06321 [Leishmania martiniquensis]
MVASFFSHHYACPIGDASTLPGRLRRFLTRATRERMSAETFTAAMRKELEQRPSPAPPSTTAPRQEEPELEGGHASSVEELIEAHNAAATAAARRKLCYMLTASALANFADGAHRSFAVEAMCRRARAYGFDAGKPADVADALVRMGFSVHPYGKPTRNGKARLLDESALSDTSKHFLIVQGVAHAGLPRCLRGDWVFQLGARFTGTASAREGAYEGHYAVTAKPREATVGVYTVAPPRAAEAAEQAEDSRTLAAPTVGRQAAEAGAPRGTHAKDPFLADAGRAEEDGLSTTPPDTAPGELLHEQHAALYGETALPLKNGDGGRAGGRACPRGWYIYPDRPPHVSAVSPEVRAGHIRWLRELRSMPSDLLDCDLAKAVIHLIVRAARARNWQWSTISKALASVKGALLNLPLYTNQADGYDLSTSPEFRAAATAARRFERESETHPPAPLRVEEMRRAYKELCRTHPRAALFLKLAWHCAARAGDLGTLLTKDVHISTLSESSPTVSVSITIRYGKGARFRGPYAIGTRLQREDAALLLKLVRSRGPTQRLFADVTSLRDQLRAALRRVNPAAALPSIRKGAARYLAANGVSEAGLMRITGHTRADTLKRYLGYGLQQTKEAVAVQESAAQVLLGLAS